MTAARRNATFLVAFLAAGLVIAVFVSPFASSSPDGLEKVSEDEGFAGAAEDHGLSGSPLADYGVEGIDHDRVGTGVAGLIGVVVTLAVGAGAFALVRRLRPPDAAA